MSKRHRQGICLRFRVPNGGSSNKIVVGDDVLVVGGPKRGFTGIGKSITDEELICTVLLDCGRKPKKFPMALLGKISADDDEETEESSPSSPDDEPTIVQRDPPNYENWLNPRGGQI